MKRGSYAEAMRHLALAREIWVNAEDLTMRAQLSRLTANVHLLASQPGESLKAAREAVRFYERTAARHSLLAALSTIAENHLLLRQHSDAEAVLNRMLTLNGSTTSKLTTFDSLVHVAIARDDVPTALKYLADVDALGSFPQENYSWLWHVSTRAKLLLKQNEPERALRLVREHADLGTEDL